MESSLLTMMTGKIRAYARALKLGRKGLIMPSPGQEYRRGREGPFHSSPEIFLQLSGYTDFSFPEEELRLDEGEILIVPARVPHMERVGGAKDAFRNIVILPDGGSILCHIAWEEAAGRPGILHTENRKPELAPALGLWLQDALRWGRKDRALAASLTAAALFAQAGVLDEKHKNDSAESRLVGRARRMIRDRLGDPRLSVASLAQAIPCSADYLSHHFKQSSGQSLVDYIQGLRMQRAADFLRNSELSSKEVAWACGYANQSYFIRLFRERYGSSPLEYRSALQATLLGDQG